MKLPVYLDNHSTTPVDPRVLKAMVPFFTEKFGNPSGKGHSFGWEADSAVEQGRRVIAKMINASASEIYFTGSTTESINLAHFGIAESYMGKGNHIVTSAIEHPAVLDSLKALESKGFSVTYLPVNGKGFIDTGRLSGSITSGTILVSVMTANNEIGIINDIAAIGKICREKGVLFHTDAAQAAGKILLDVREMNIDALSFSAHKMYGPKGTGALFLRKGIKAAPQVYGGGQEKGLRPGTLNVPAIVGFGKAAELCTDEMESEKERLKEMRDKLYKEIAGNLDGVHVNGSLEMRLPNNLNLRFTDVRSDNLLLELRDIALSTGSSCSSESLKGSHVLKALGLNDEEVSSSVRIGIGRFTTDEEIGYASKRIVESIIKLRSITPIKRLKITENE